MQGSLAGKVAIVTGAGGGGCGRAIALRFAREGACVVVNDQLEQGGVATVEAIERDGGTARFYRADAGDAEQLRALVAFAESVFGAVDVVVNNGSSIGSDEFLDGWFEPLRVNLVGAMHLARYAIDAMKRHGRGGAILNVGSISALGHGLRHSHWPGYDVAKAGIMRFTTTLAPLWESDRICVNCIVPGWIASPGPLEYWESLTPAERSARGIPQRLIEPAEIAAVALRLVTDHSLAGRLFVWWDDRDPFLIAARDAGYAEAVDFTG